MARLDEVTLSGEVETYLSAITNLGGRVYNGYVPEEVEEAGGYIRPYVVLFAGLAGDLPLERCLAREVDPLILDWAPQINCVGATSSQALAVAVDVKNSLNGARVGNHWLKVDADAMRSVRPILDTQVTPARFFLPVSFTLLTN